MMSTTSEFASAEEPVLMRAIQPQKGMKYACILDEQGNDIISFHKGHGNHKEESRSWLLCKQCHCCQK